MKHQLNILFITTDQHRYDSFGFMGHPDVKTPHLDRLAENGVVFERTYVTNPVCMPSRATWLTGQYPDAHGVRRNGIEIPDQPWGLGRVLKRNGWKTGIFGKTHFCSLRRDYQPSATFHNWRAGEDYYGFQSRAITQDIKDYVSHVEPHSRSPHSQRDPVHMYIYDDYVDWIRDNHPDYLELALREGLPPGKVPLASELWHSELPVELHESPWIADQTMGFIERHQHEPFFAWCSFVDPHHPFNAPAPYRQQYDPETLAPAYLRLEELDRRSRYHRDRFHGECAHMRPHTQEYRAQYYGMITLIDDQIGRIVKHLEDLGIADRTVIVFTADHGEMLGDHGLFRKGLFHYEQLIRVPLVLYGPGQLARGVRQGGIVSSVDIPSTIVGLVDIPKPIEYQGMSLVPWCHGVRHDPPRTYALVTNGGEGPHYDPWPELRTVVGRRYKLHHYGGEDHIELDDLEQNPRELYPLEIDEHAGLVRSMLGKLIDASSAASTWWPHVGRW